MLETGPSFPERFWPLVAAGLLGVLTLPLTFPPSLDESLRAAAPGIAPGVLKALTLIQPALLLAAGAATGAALAHRLGLTSHLAGVNVRRRLVHECSHADRSKPSHPSFTCLQSCSSPWSSRRLICQPLPS